MPIFFYIGDKRLGGQPSLEETADPHLLKKVKSPKHNRRRRRKEMWWKLSPQQVIVMLWIKIISPLKVPRS
ncbi:hypothetical protein AB205_0037960 [Aquarana catesbeiana]|uniref:Uncharacterized protein n=1 Tax=Aquarana catesbeiana TaxID=8400 RepID=A0A2G9QLP8_AQUCT|nr:hypothetical protein AB205_0037960 [Aquarana catesbeiana]